VLLVEVRGPARAPVSRHAVVVDARGWLVMAGPTIGPADTVHVRLRAGLSVPATPVGSDARTALTLLQLPRLEVTLTPLALPEVHPRQPLRTNLEVGAQVVMVTGTGAVARGRVRALERVRTLVDAARGATERATGLVEAAVASVAHDVGSPWVDSQGRCVGLLVGGLAEEPLGEEGVPPDLEIRPEPVASHAVPAEVVALVWPMLRDHQTVQRSRLGVKARPAGEALREHVCGGCGGQEIESVDVGGPAEIAGLQAEDLLLALDGVPLRAGGSLADALLPYRPLDTVTITVVRRGEKLTRKVVLAPR
jgi:S1-C subfamily serine protease